MAKSTKTVNSPISQKNNLLPRVLNLALPEIPQAKVPRDLRKPYIPFGELNQFPQELAELARESATLKPVLKSIASYIAGEKLILPARHPWVKKVNPRDTLRKVLKLCAYDYKLTGNGWIQLKETIEDGEVVTKTLHWLDTTKCRLRRPDDIFGDPTHVEINAAWHRRYRSADSLVIPLWPEFEEINGDRYSVFHLKDEEPGFDYYGIPSWLGAIHYAKMEFLIGMFNHNTFKNGLFSSGILEVMMSTTDDDEVKAFVKQLQKDLLGTENENTMKVLILPKTNEEQIAQYTEINRNYEGSWVDLKDMTVQTIITASNWFTSLAGIQSEGKLGNNQQIINEHRIATSNTMDDRQLFIDAINEISEEWLEMKANVQVIKDSPVKDELYDSGQIQAFIKVYQSLSAGEITPEEAKYIIEESLNLKEPIISDRDNIEGGNNRNSVHLHDKRPFFNKGS